VIRLAVAAAALASLLVASPGGARPAADPGVTPTSVLLGATVPLTGPAAAFGALAPGAAAYFKYVNARGGVNGRKINFTYLDDGYEPARTVQGVRQLVQQDNVFAIFASVGTENNIAVRPFLNAMKVPQLFVGDGSSELGANYRRYPWTMGYLPSYLGEGAMYGRNIARTKPKAKIAVLVESSPLGNDLLAGLKRGLGKSGATIVATESHAPTDPDVNAQIVSLRGSRADTLMLFTTPQYVIQSFIQMNKLGWKPTVYVNSISIEPTVMKIATLSTSAAVTANAISMAWLKDPTNPRWAKDKGVRLYKEIMRRYYPAGRLTDVYNYAGMAFAFTMVDALRKAGRNLTRAGLLRAATHLNETDNPFVLPGIAIRTSPTNYYPISRAQLYRYRKGRWQPFSGLLAARG
jgi:branched-chain amino acid transport system substrate-binding protein